MYLVSIPDDYVLLNVNGEELNIRYNYENDILDLRYLIDKPYRIRNPNLI